MMRWFIIIALAVLGVMPTAEHRCDNIGRDAIVAQTEERPQWVDLGMTDLIAAVGSTSMTAPTGVRVLGGSATANAACRWHDETVRNYVAQRNQSHYGRVADGYIYRLRCLRL